MLLYNLGLQCELAGAKKEKHVLMKGKINANFSTHFSPNLAARDFSIVFSPDLATVQGIPNLKIIPPPVLSSRVRPHCCPHPWISTCYETRKLPLQIFPQIWRSLKHSKSENFQKPSALITFGYCVANASKDWRRGDRLLLPASSHLRHQFHQIIYYTEAFGYIALL